MTIVLFHSNYSYLSIYLSVCLSIYLSIYLSTCLFTHISVYIQKISKTHPKDIQKLFTSLRDLAYRSTNMLGDTIDRKVTIVFSIATIAIYLSIYLFIYRGHVFFPSVHWETAKVGPTNCSGYVGENQNNPCNKLPTTSWIFSALMSTTSFKRFVKP